MKTVAVALVAMVITFGTVLATSGYLQLPAIAGRPAPTAASTAVPGQLSPVDVAYRELLARLAEYDRLYAVGWWPHLSPAEVEQEIDRRGAGGESWLRDYYQSPGGRLYFAWSLERKQFLQSAANRILADYLDWLALQGRPRQPNTRIARDVDTLADFLYPYVDDDY